MTSRFRCVAAGAAALLSALAGCGGSGNAALPQLSAATGATLPTCNDLATRIAFNLTTITSATAVAAGTLTVAGTPVPAHCRVVGKMNERLSLVDNVTYAIGFEMRLPNEWNGRFFYQANGGIDGTIVTATGAVNGGAGLTNALAMGFAVLSSDAGHLAAQGPNFGIDPEARRDYAYSAAIQLTPMAKSAIRTAYGKGPDRSYFGGCSNGGRHTMIAAARMPEQYDGYLIGDPGFRLPLAAIANMAAAQGYATVASTPGDITTGFTAAERAMVSTKVLAKCDALDGATDGLIQDTTACQAAFSLDRDVPTCSGARDGTCLSAAQKTVIGKRFAGLVTPNGTKIYTSFPYDSGFGGGNTAFWNFTAPLALDSGATAFIWQVPPENPTGFVGATFALNGNLDTMLAKVAATNSVYNESALSAMIPPNPSRLGVVRDRGAKIMAYHGTSDPIFSSDDTTQWYESVRFFSDGDASDFARFFRVPGMTHCSGGPTTDQFDMLTPLVNWVEKGQVPASVIASARGPGNAAGANADVPATWSATRTRPLCPYPQVARYKGTGSPEIADSFACQ
jgi:Tannase and feruloyl esterase